MKKKQCSQNVIVVDVQDAMSVNRMFESFLIAFGTFAKERLHSRIRVLGATNDLRDTIEQLGESS